ncbi:MAG: CpsD/CapB family tyrosine-protein kinase [Chloroflexota bacterium]|nr:CpsD/CapB family tyrosine-protein kinase [Chloroflexota bacterium]
MSTQRVTDDQTPQLTARAIPGMMLRTRHAGAPETLAQSSREWLFPGADEVFRGIYTRAGMGFASEVLAVCSAIAGEGRTTVSVGLAVTIAQDFPDRRVLLVEMDLERPALAQDFALEETPGLIECIVSGEPLQNACRPSFLENLHLVPGGGKSLAAGRPLRSSRLAEIVDTMRQNYDLVILDLPPMLVNSDAALLTDLADGAIYVVRSGITPTALVGKALEQVEESKLRGVVLNSTQSAVPTWLHRMMGL